MGKTILDWNHWENSTPKMMALNALFPFVYPFTIVFFIVCSFVCLVFLLFFCLALSLYLLLCDDTHAVYYYGINQLRKMFYFRNVYLIIDRMACRYHLFGFSSFFFFYLHLFWLVSLSSAIVSFLASQ